MAQGTVRRWLAGWLGCYCWNYGLGVHSRSRRLAAKTKKFGDIKAGKQTRWAEGVVPRIAGCI
jgi:hypothetical protein